MTKISIIIPSYNRGSLIGETLDSVFAQTDSRWECVIVDDHSTDNTAEVVKSYIDRDERVRYVINAFTKGAQGARNTGVKEATGDHLMFVDSDDLLAPICVEKRLSLTQQKPGFDMYCFNIGVFHEKVGDSNFIWNNLHKPAEDIARFLMLDGPWHTSGSLWKRNVFESFSGWDEKIVCFQDLDIHLRFLFSGKYSYLKDDSDDIHGYYRRGRKESISGNFLNKETVDTKIYLTEKFFQLIKESGGIMRYRDYFKHFITHVAITIAFYDPQKSADYFKEYLHKLEYSPLYQNLWYAYYKNRMNKSHYKIVRKAFDIIPLLTKYDHTVKNKNTLLSLTR